jgi:hypothetical protein
MLAAHALPSIRSKAVLDQLHRRDGQITDFGRPVGQIFFDPAPGNARAERIEWEVFSLLREEGWIATEDEGAIKRYRISEAGFAHLFAHVSGHPDEAESQGRGKLAGIDRITPQKVHHSIGIHRPVQMESLSSVASH